MPDPDLKYRAPVPVVLRREMPYRVGNRGSMLVFALAASATAVGTGALLWERANGRDPGRQFNEEIKTFSLLMPFGTGSGTGSKGAKKE